MRVSDFGLKGYSSDTNYRQQGVLAGLGAVNDALTAAQGRIQAKTKKAGKAASALGHIGSAVGTATGIAAAAGAANAVPIAGQIASAALGVAALFIKIFAGRRKRRRERARMRRRESLAQASMNIKAGMAFDQKGGVGLGSQGGPVGTTAPVWSPSSPAFSGWEGGSQEPVQPSNQEFSVGQRQW